MGVSMTIATKYIHASAPPVAFLPTKWETGGKTMWKGERKGKNTQGK